jgi:hypothetical protein
MPVKNATRNGRMTNVDRLSSLFRAFRERNDEGFYRVAEAIIADELAANHHAEARDLERALSITDDERPLARSANGLSMLPKERRSGEPLVAVTEPRLDANRVILGAASQNQIDRILQEHG